MFTIFKWLLIKFFFLSSVVLCGQQQIQFKKISCPEKWWVIIHPFVALKAKRVTTESTKKVEEIKNSKVLKGTGSGDQVDAFRHVYWMARLTQEIGKRRSRSLGVAHEKGNYRDFKKRRNEDGKVPDKIASEMDLYNNDVGINLGSKSSKLDLEEMVKQIILSGQCKIIKVDEQGNYLDRKGNIIQEEDLKGKWENGKCLVNSNL